MDWVSGFAAWGSELTAPNRIGSFLEARLAGTRSLHFCTQHKESELQSVLSCIGQRYATLLENLTELPRNKHVAQHSSSRP